MLRKTTLCTIPALLLAKLIGAAPSGNPLSNPNYGPKPGESPLYNDYLGKAPPFPANYTKPIAPTKSGAPGPDDVLWQNLLSAEWVIYSFYQYGVETFNTSSFVELGLPNTTYTRIQEIRDNEAGHLRIFQDQISATSIKPGACQYNFDTTIGSKPEDFLGAALAIEVSSMLFLTGLVQTAKLDAAKGALTAVSQVETRHGVWALLDVYGADPFSGPSDTVFPYANEILDLTTDFIVSGSCPSANPPYPNPSQNLPPVGIAMGTKSVAPGATVQLNFTNPANQPTFDSKCDYYGVFYHGLDVISTLLDTTKWPAQPINITIPAEFDAKGIVAFVITTEEGAPTLDSVVTRPNVFLQQPAGIGALFSI
ncbi:ferritin-like domain-containing protein [Xylariaceae sp. FL0255]|nr:ferritin-like domain-containing protein [Xylariaceae sp. FL0255]